MPDDDAHATRSYYDCATKSEDARLTRHQLEFDMTIRYLEAYLPSTGRILEIGAATGRYTAWLAKRGHHVTAVDLSKSLLDQCKRRLEDDGLTENVRCYAADARDLTSIPGTDFDTVLLMGPLYHLTLGRNRLVALRESVARLRPGGILISALISRYGILGHLLKHVPQWIEDQQTVRSIIDHGHDTEDAHTTGFHGYYAITDEIIPLHEQAGLETLLLAGVEPAISADDESYNALTGGRRAMWLDLLFEVSREPSVVASSRHLLYVGRKPR